mmetsp:Transcript_22168/g.62138  ORF Transcript_22168/g.62138 Transcript_22168/m.62138 type:complete len:137 (-) Transcript_22168:154-564(-)
MPPSMGQLFAAYFDKRWSALATIDPLISIEVLFFTRLLGFAREAALQNLVSDFMPIARKTKTIEASGQGQADPGHRLVQALRQLRAEQRHPRRQFVDQLSRRPIPTVSRNPSSCQASIMTSLQHNGRVVVSGEERT